MSMYPTPGNARPVDPVLSGFVAGLANQESNFVADRILPVIHNSTSTTMGEESYSTGTIQRFADNALFGDPSANDVIAPGGTYPRDRGGDFDPLTFACQKYGRETPVTWELLKRLQGAGRLGAEQAKLAPMVHTLRLLKEVRMAAYLENALWTETHAAAVGWDEDAGNPNLDIITAMESVRGAGIEANTVVFSRSTFAALAQNNNFLEYMDVGIDRTALYVPGALESVMRGRYGITRVIIAAAIRNTDMDPTDDPTLEEIFTDQCWVGYLPETMSSAVTASGAATDVSILTPTAGARIVELDWGVERYQEHQTDSDILKVRYSEVDKVVSPLLGYRITNVQQA